LPDTAESRKSIVRISASMRAFEQEEGAEIAKATG
jgi:hypothetical protein